MYENRDGDIKVKSARTSFLIETYNYTVFPKRKEIKDEVISAEKRASLNIKRDVFDERTI